MEQKKETNGQLQRRLKNALIHIDKTKDTKSVFFDDKGLRLTINEDVAIIETGYHRHVFNSYTNTSVSNPWLFTRRLVDTAIENDVHSYEKLLDLLKAKEDKSDYNFAIYYNWWLLNIFQPLYTIGNTDIATFLVYEDYMYNIAKQTAILSEKKEDVTNKQFVNDIISTMQEAVSSIDEIVLFKKQTDEELIEENIKAIQEQEQEQIINAQNGASED